MHRLFAGERVSGGRYFKTKDAVLHTRAERRPPFYVSAFGKRAAGVAARLGDGLWTLADPEAAPPIIDAYRAACEDAGHEPGEILLHAGFSWAPDDEAAFEGSKVWKAAFPKEFYRDDWHDPKAMQEHAQANVSDDEFRNGFLIGSDTAAMADRVREMEKLGATIVVLMNISGADPHGAIQAYGSDVLPALRGARAG
jgi:coenzyme F420-dependent glucose-6-phosphate dehydrogenase